MKKWLLIFIIYFINIDTVSYSVLSVLPNFYEVEKIYRQKEKQNNIDSYLDFKEKLGQLESSNQYDIINHTGSYWGKYQFSKIALNDININVNRKYFISNPLLQEIALYQYLQKNEFYLSDEISRYQNTCINGYYITKTGILASAHLVGHNAIKLFLESKGEIIIKDGNNTPLTKYMKEFSTYNFEFSKEIETYLSNNYGTI